MRIGLSVFPITRAALVLGLVFAAFACDDETSPGTPITLETIWPNENGRSWEYLWTSGVFEGATSPDTAAIYANENDVPPAPDISSILPLLDHPSTPDSVFVDTQTWGLQFQDSTTTLSGVTAQNLVSFSDTPTPQNPAPKRAASPFLDYLLRARPDLRERVLGLTGVAAQAADSVDFELLLLHGGAWEKTTGWIGMYGDLDAELAWIYMDSTLTFGHRFTHQLIPSIVDDAFLHGLVRRTVTAETSAGTFERALEIVYVIDFGVAQASDPDTGDPIGYFRTINYGNVLFAPSVGPVAAYERVLISVGETLGDGIGEVSLDLTAVSEVLTARH